MIAIKPMPKPGWSVETVKGKYAAEYELHGSKLTEGVKEVIWSGGKLADDNYDEFIMASFLTPAEAEQHALFPGGSGMRAGCEPLDRNLQRKEQGAADMAMTASRRHPASG